MTRASNIPDTSFQTDTSDMIGVHNVFRDAFRAGPDLIGKAGEDPNRVELVATYLDNVLRLLDVHHQAEDELLTPKLQQRCPPDQRQTVDEVAAQHGPVHGDLHETLNRISSWRAHPSEATANSVRSALKPLGDALITHLDDEERLVLPIASQYIDAAEWGALPGHAMRTFSGDKLWLILGLVFEQMTPDQAADARAHMPPPVTKLWSEQGERLFGDFRAQLTR